MQELRITNNTLPEKFEDVAAFAVFTQEKLKALRAEISAMNRLGLAQEVVKQKTEEAIELAEIKTRAEMRLGELTRIMPKQPGARTDLTSSPTMTRLETKTDALNRVNIPKQRASQYERMAAHPDVVEQAIAEARDKGDVVSRSGILKKVREVEKQLHREEKAERKAFTLSDEMPDDVCKLYKADIRDGLSVVPDNSVDFIITDPPYPAEYIPLYGDLSKLAARVLKPGGSLIVMCGQSYLPQVIAQLSTSMKYHWCMAYTTPGGQSPQLFHKRVNTFWKPVLWFVKGDYNGDYVGDVLKSPVNDNDKRFHEWGQSYGGMRDIIDRFTNAGDVILDPFLGGGTTGVAAVTTGRKFIGSDVKQENVDVSYKRIKEEYSNAGSKN